MAPGTVASVLVPPGVGVVLDSSSQALSQRGLVDLQAARLQSCRTQVPESSRGSACVDYLRRFLCGTSDASRYCDVPFTGQSTAA